MNCSNQEITYSSLGNLLFRLILFIDDIIYCDFRIENGWI